MICWVSELRGRDAMGDPPDGWTVAEIPAEIGRAEDRAEVEVLIPNFLADLDLTALPGLRLIQTLTAGVDWIVDRVPDGVVLCDAAGPRDAAMAEWIVAAILADYKLARQCAELHAARRWEHIDDLRDLEGAYVLILGYGSIGRAVEARLKPVRDRDREGRARRSRGRVHG